MLYVPSTRTALLTSHVSMAWESTISQDVRGVYCTVVTVRSVGRHCLPVISACHGRLHKYRDVHSVPCMLSRTLGGQRGTSFKKVQQVHAARVLLIVVVQCMQGARAHSCLRF